MTRPTSLPGMIDGAPDGARRVAPAAERNLAPLRAALVEVLADLSGDLLEIGSGTGQHAAGIAAALPGLDWWPTDPAASARASIDAWREDAGVPNLHAATPLDAARPWPLGRPGGPPTPLAAVFSANVVHIAPSSVLDGLLAGAGEHLRPGGRLLFYGPFMRDGAHTAPSNADFDASLRGRDPAWGVRDATSIERAAAGLGLRTLPAVAMPANNELLVFERQR